MDYQQQVVKSFLEQAPVAKMLGLEIQELGPSRSVIALPVRPELTYDGTTVQGGLVATLADFAAVASAATASRENQFVATVGCEAHNLAPARGSRLVAVGRLVSRPGKRMVAAADVFVDSEDGVHCLTGLFMAAALG